MVAVSIATANTIIPMSFKGSATLQGSKSLAFALKKPQVEVIVYPDDDTQPILKIGNGVIRKFSYTGVEVEGNITKLYTTRFLDHQITIEIENKYKSSKGLQKLIKSLCAVPANRQLVRGKGEMDLIYINPDLKKGFFIKIDSCQ